jgi:putative membrane protein
MKTQTKFTVLLLGATLTATAFAAGELKHRDHEFVEDAAKSGMAEVDISKIAVDRATNPDVKAFAQMMVADHTGANTELTTLASTKNVALPADKTNVEKWSERSTKDFDQEYVDKMIHDHKKAVDLFEKESKNGTDPDLKAFADKTLPTLRAHLEKIESIKAQMK